MLAEIRREVRSRGSVEAAANALRFFKTGPGEYGEGDRFLGVRVPELRQLARKYRELPRTKLPGLLQSPFHEERLLGLLIMTAQYPRADEPNRQALFDLYIAHTAYINNWDLVDTSAPHIVGEHLRTRDRKLLYRFVGSASLWERRIAIIATQQFIRHGEFDDTFELSERLLGDKHDLIHKAVGWMLREVGKRNEHSLESFLHIHAARMPRTMLRYAIERFPEPKRKAYLQFGQT